MEQKTYNNLEDFQKEYELVRDTLQMYIDENIEELKRQLPGYSLDINESMVLELRYGTYVDSIKSERRKVQTYVDNIKRESLEK